MLELNNMTNIKNRYLKFGIGVSFVKPLIHNIPTQIFQIQSVLKNVNLFYFVIKLKILQ